MSTVTSGIEIFLSRPREADEYREFIRRLEKDHQEQVNVIGKRITELSEKLIAFQESEAVWKTERDKADQRRLEAEQQLEMERVANRRELIAVQIMAALYVREPVRRADMAEEALLGADALIAALDTPKAVITQQESTPWREFTGTDEIVQEGDEYSGQSIGVWSECTFQSIGKSASDWNIRFRTRRPLPPQECDFSHGGQRCSAVVCWHDSAPQVAPTEENS